MSKLAKTMGHNQLMYNRMDYEFENLENIIMNALKELDAYEKQVESSQTE